MMRDAGLSERACGRPDSFFMCRLGFTDAFVVKASPCTYQILMIYTIRGNMTLLIPGTPSSK